MNVTCGLSANTEVQVAENRVRRSQYRPFTCQFIYFDPVLVHRRGQLPFFFPNAETESENRAIGATAHSQTAFSAQAFSLIPALDVGGRPTQIFPYYTYSEDGSNRRENITDWALEQFRSHYHDPSITKWDIFHYVYAVLHHPEYRSRYAANLKRELPRIPFLGVAHSATKISEGHGLSRADTAVGQDAALAAEGRTQSDAERLPSAAKAATLTTPTGAAEGAPLRTTAALKACATLTAKEIFWEFAKAGKRLAEIHVHYETQPEYKLEKIWKQGAKLDYRVTKMRLSNKDKSVLFYNDAITLKGIPLETYDYRLGNRSALEWVIDQYQISTDKRSGITNDPNRTDDPQYILRLLGQVITVSLETVQIVNSLPAFVISEPAKGATAS